MDEEPPAAPQSYSCRMVDGISGAGKPIGLDMLASAKGASIAFSEEPRR
jgi:hypothetical protein